MKIATLTLTEVEGQVLVNLLDVAIRAQGLKAAESALVLAKKIEVAFNPPKKQEEAPAVNGAENETAAVQ